MQFFGRLFLKIFVGIPPPIFLNSEPHLVRGAFYKPYAYIFISNVYMVIPQAFEGGVCRVRLVRFHPQEDRCH